MGRFIGETQRAEYNFSESLRCVLRGLGFIRALFLSDVLPHERE